MTDLWKDFSRCFNMSLILEIFVLVFGLINIVIHSIGCHLLRYLVKNVEQTPQIIYVFQLSVCQILLNILVSLATILKMASLETAHVYVDLVYLSGPWLVYFLLMCAITFDKLLEIILHLRYPRFWNDVKATRMAIVGWMAGVLLTIFTCLYHMYSGGDILKTYFTYWYPTFHFFFIILTVTTYVIIFRHFKRSRVAPHNFNVQPGHAKSLSAFRIFLKSRFYTVVLLIGTYVLLVVIPDLVYLFYGYLQNNDKKYLLEIICYLSYTIEGSTDAYIYIFLQPSVRRLLWKKLRMRQTEEGVGNIDRRIARNEPATIS